jgi:hypothetical protein
MFVYSLDGLQIDGDVPPDQEIEEDEAAGDGKWPERRLNSLTQTHGI